MKGKAKLIQEWLGECLMFNGQNGCKALIPTDAIQKLQNEFTVSFWFKCTNLSLAKTNADSMTLLGYGWDWQFRIYPHKELIRVIVAVDDKSSNKNKMEVITAKYKLKKDKWYRLDYTYSSKQGKAVLFINEEKLKAIKLKNKTANVKLKKHDICLGSSPGKWNPFSGCIGQLQIYNKALTSEEVKKIPISGISQILEHWRTEINVIRGKNSAASKIHDNIKAIYSKLEKIKSQKSMTNGEYQQIQSQLLKLNAQSKGVNDAELNIKNCLSFIVHPISSQKILPDSKISMEKLGSTLKVIAAQGEYIPASFVLKPFQDIKGLTIEKTSLTSNKSEISASNIDIKIVKCWYQSYYAWNGIIDIKDSRRQLVSELLLNDDSLVLVDYKTQNNYLKLTPSPKFSYYAWISKTANSNGSRWSAKISNQNFPVKDSHFLRPCNIAENTNKQFWVTIKVPSNTPAAVYKGKLNLSSKQAFLEL